MNGGFIESAAELLKISLRWLDAGKRGSLLKTLFAPKERAAPSFHVHRVPNPPELIDEGEYRSDDSWSRR
jgi:hypothetical protein